MSIGSMRRIVAKLESRAQSLADRRLRAAQPVFSEDASRDSRLVVNELAVIDGSVAPGAFHSDLPVELQLLATQRVRDLVGAAEFLRDSESVEIRRAIAWLASLEGGDFCEESSTVASVETRANEHPQGVSENQQ
jgi:hypothetical protein